MDIVGEAMQYVLAQGSTVQRRLHMVELFAGTAGITAAVRERSLQAEAFDRKFDAGQDICQLEGL
eukprot:4680307-Prorocentrum_lima.AAC.1